MNHSGKDLKAHWEKLINNHPAIEKENEPQEFSQDLSSAFEKAFDNWASGITDDGDDNG